MPTATTVDNGNHTFTVTCAGATDKAGNTAGSVLVTYTVRPADSLAPNVVGTPDRAANERDWYDGPVTITWTSTDPDPSSGTPTTPQPTVLRADGANQTATSAESCDPAGNCASGTYGPVNIDSADPSINGSASDTANEHGWHNQPSTVSFTCTDDLSGVLSCTEQCQPERRGRPSHAGPVQRHQPGVGAF